MNLASIIDSHAAQLPAFISQGRTTTYGDLRTGRRFSWIINEPWRESWRPSRNGVR